MATKHEPKAWDMYRMPGGGLYMILENKNGRVKLLDSDDGAIVEMAVEALLGGGRDTFVAKALALPKLVFALSRIAADLPANRDWLDPDIEKLARTALREAIGEMEV